MEDMMTQRVTPLLKCVVLFLFIFTAKVLTSRPQESQDSRHGIHHTKLSPRYVRTFTRYHHRRTIQWNLQDVNGYWPLALGKEQSKHIGKRSVETFDSKEFVNNGIDVLNLNHFGSDSGKDNTVVSLEKDVIGPGKDGGSKNGLPLENTIKVKQAIVIPDETTTTGPKITCLYKMHSIINSVTPSYKDPPDSQMTVDSEIYDNFGKVSQEIFSDGKEVLTQLCTDPQAACYTLYQDNNDNVTILGQGCWRASTSIGGGVTDDRCSRVSNLPNSMFCQCTRSYCNADFRSFREEIVTPRAELNMNAESQAPSYPNLVALGVLTTVLILALALLFTKIYCRKPTLDKEDDSTDLEKGEVMGTGSDSLATGLHCVDNLTLIEHIGQGKFGSVWRGQLGATPVAVKLFANASAWQKEAAVYSMPHLSHPNLLRYYGSDSRVSPTDGSRTHLLVLELCAETLRARLQRAPLAWLEFARVAHGAAAALAHLHAARAGRCLVHRDLTSDNVLLTAAGVARLADLGLAQALGARGGGGGGGAWGRGARVTEAGTLRYLAPEALEGALDLSGARAALCAVDVYALALVLWEALWRTAPAHAGAAPPYAAPYSHHGLPARPTLAQMQSLVSRKKARPPLPRGPVPEARALKLAADTCDECWDHDAEARLTAVCVEERMAELKTMLLAQGPVIHDNNLHPHSNSDPSPPSEDKNSNCVSAQAQAQAQPRACEASAPLLPAPHTGRNACIERNTHTQEHAQASAPLIHKSLKDITVPAETPRRPAGETCLSVARTTRGRRLLDHNTDRAHELRAPQRPLAYVPNDVTALDTDRPPKDTNLKNRHELKTDKPKWGIRKFFERKLSRAPRETEVKLVPDDGSPTGAGRSGRIETSVVNEKTINFDRPDRNGYSYETPGTLSPPNRTLSPTMLMESEMNRSENKVFKRLPSDENENAPNHNRIYAVIVPKARPGEHAAPELRSRTSASPGSSESVNKRSVRTSMSSQSILKSGHSESEDSTTKKRLSCDNRIITDASNSGRSSRASVNLELTYLEQNRTPNYNGSPYDINSDCSTSEDEHLMLLSENNGSKITMQTLQKPSGDNDKRKYPNEVLKEATQTKPDSGTNKHQYKYRNFDNEFSDPTNDKENLNGYSVDNPVYLAALNGEINSDSKLAALNGEVNSDSRLAALNCEIDSDNKLFRDSGPRSPRPSLKGLAIKRQRSLEQVSELFTSSGDVHLLNPAGRVKTPGDLPAAVRKARRDRVLQKGRATECNRLSLYDDRMMFGSSL